MIMIIMCHHPGPTRMIPTVAAASWPDRAIPFPAARRPPNKGKPLWVSYRRREEGEIHLSPGKFIYYYLSLSFLPQAEQEQAAVGQLPPAAPVAARRARLRRAGGAVHISQYYTRYIYCV